MALTSKARIDLFERIHDELDSLLNRKFTKHIKLVVCTMYDYDSSKLTDLWRKLQRLNRLASDDRVKRDWKLRYKKLILSINNINDADSHPIGLDLSIFLYSDSAQSTLNVKHVTSQQYRAATATSAAEAFRQHVEQVMHLEFSRIVPKIDPTLLYGNDKSNWVRVRISGAGGTEQAVDRICYSMPANLKLVALFNYSPTIVEFYFADKNVSACLEYFDASPYVEEIVFYSNCKLVKQKCDSSRDYLLFVSNQVKFFYAYLNTSSDLSIRSTSDMLKLNYYYLLSNVFVYKNNLKTSHCETLTTPLNILTGPNPKGNIFNKVHSMEDLTAYDILSIAKGEDLRPTAMSERSLNYGAKHKMYELANDRDFRLIGHGSRMGGRNLHELAVKLAVEKD